MKKIFIVLLTLFFVNCATTGKFKNALDSYLGRNSQELVNIWGYPERTFQNPVGNGNTIFVYETKSQYTTDQVADKQLDKNGNSTTTITGGITYTYWCNTYFEINSSGIIISYIFKGNNCKSR